MTSEEVRKAVELAIAPLVERIEALTYQVSELEQKLDPKPQTEIIPQQEACKRLQMSPRTLQRRRVQWGEGVHWWKESSSDRPLYNLPLICDGERQGFNSPAHLQECRQWAKAQSRQGRR